MALESEAASIWCQTIPLVIPTEDDRVRVVTAGSKYMVVDIGGKAFFANGYIYTYNGDIIIFDIQWRNVQKA